MTGYDAAFVRPRVAAGVLFLDVDGRVLLVEQSYRTVLDLPGGMVEHGETPAAGAVREIHEELGIRPPIGRLLVADWWQTAFDGSDIPTLLLVFDGGVLPAADLERIVVDGHEVIGFGFYGPVDLPSVTVPRLVNRIEHAVAARRDGYMRCLEDGAPPGTPDGPRADRAT